MSESWWNHPGSQRRRKVDLTTETTVNIDFVWATDADLLDCSEIVIKEIHHYCVQSVTPIGMDVKIEQPVGTAIGAGFAIQYGTAVPISGGRGKAYPPPGLYLNKVDGNVRVTLTMASAMNPGRFWLTFHKNKVS
jgi:hypothetical protein